MQNFGRFRSIVHIKNLRFTAIGKNGFQVFYLLAVEFFTHIFHQKNIPKEIGSQRSVSGNYIFYNAQSRKSKHHQFVVGRQIAFNNVLQRSIKFFQFRTDNGFINIFFILKIGIKRAAAISRFFGNFVHSGAFDTFFREKLPSHFH